MAAVDHFRPRRVIITQQSVLTRIDVCAMRLRVVPRHPGGWVLGQFVRVTLQLGQVFERIGAIQFARVDQAHEQITDLRAFLRLIE
jgi:hypothetical protein